MVAGLLAALQIDKGCLVQVGNGTELEAVGLQFELRTLPVAPLWCDLGFVPNSRGNKAAANLRPKQLLDPPASHWHDIRNTIGQ